MGFLAALVPVIAGAAGGGAGLAGIGGAASLAGGVLGAIGAEREASARAAELNYQAAIADNNKQVAQRNAGLKMAEGEQEAFNTGMRTRQKLGAIKAGQAASGIRTDVGSAVDVQASEAEIGKLDALTVRSNAARAAYNYDVDAGNFGAQAEANRVGAKNAKASGHIAAISSLLGGAASAAGKFAAWQDVGGATPKTSTKALF